MQIREAVEDLDVRGMRVPKGTWIHVAVCAIQRDPDIWRQPARIGPSADLDACVLRHTCRLHAMMDSAFLVHCC